MPSGAPYYLTGSAVVGLSTPTVGIPFGHGAESVDGAAPTVDWAEVYPPTADPELLAVQTHLDGVFAGSVEGEPSRTQLPPIRPGVQHLFDLLPVSVGEARVFEDSPQDIFRRPLRSDRVCLAWTDQPAEADFEAYLIYWNGGGAGAPSTLLAEIRDRDQLEFRSGPLAAGEHRFGLAYRDSLGNVSAQGAPYIANIPERPLAVEGLALSYDLDTRRATLTWTNPAGQPANVLAIAIFDNWAPGGSELAPHVNTSLLLRRAYLLPSATSFETFNLWEGTDRAGGFQPWRFAVIPVLCDDLGTDLAPFSEEVLALALDAGDLEQIPVPPPKPELLSVVPLAGAKWSASWEIADVSGVTLFQALEDGVVVGSFAPTAGLLSYDFERPVAGVDGATVEVLVRAFNGGVSSTDSEALPVTLDSSAPTGDGVLSGGLCI